LHKYVLFGIVVTLIIDHISIQCWKSCIHYANRTILSLFF